MTERDTAAGEQDVLAELRLASVDGRPWLLSEYRGDRSLVALFSGGAECGPCRHAVLTELCARPEEYEEAGATVLLVLNCSSMEAELVRHRDGLPVPVLLDAAGEACRRFGAVLPDGRKTTAVVVADRTGRIYLQSRPDQGGLLPTRDVILRCVRGIAAGTLAAREE